MVCTFDVHIDIAAYIYNKKMQQEVQRFFDHCLKPQIENPIENVIASMNKTVFGGSRFRKYGRRMEIDGGPFLASIFNVIFGLRRNRVIIYGF